MTKTVSESSEVQGSANTLSFTLKPSVAIPPGHKVSISELTGTQTANNQALPLGSGASVFTAAWTNDVGLLVLTVQAGQTVPKGSDTVVTVVVINPSASHTLVTPVVAVTGPDVAIAAVPMDGRVLGAGTAVTWVTSSVSESSTAAGLLNTLTFSLKPSSTLGPGQVVTVTGLRGSQTASSQTLTVTGASAAAFGSVAVWTQSSGKLVLTVDASQSLPSTSTSVVQIVLRNPADKQTGVTPSLTVSGTKVIATVAFTTTVLSAETAAKNVTFVVSGSIALFNATAFVEKVALVAGSEVHLLGVTAGSVRVLVRILSKTWEQSLAAVEADARNATGVLSSFGVLELYKHSSQTRSYFCGPNNGGCGPLSIATCAVSSVGVRSCNCTGNSEFVDGTCQEVAGISVGAAKAAAAAVTGASVGAGAASMAAGAASPAAGPAVGALIDQMQFNEIVGLVSDKNKTSKATVAFSEGFGWANYHFAPPFDGPSKKSRRRSMSHDDCDERADQAYEALIGTLFACGTVLAIVGLSRVVLVFLLDRFEARRQRKHKKRHAGKDSEIPVLPPVLPPVLFIFPRWELIVFMSQFLGLCKASAMVLASSCDLWITIGSIVYAALVAVFLVASGAILTIILRRKKVGSREFDFPRPMAVYTAMSKATGPTRRIAFLAKLGAFMTFVRDLRQNSDWAPDADIKRTFVRFLVPFVGGYRLQRYAYLVPIYEMAKKLMLGIVLAFGSGKAKGIVATVLFVVEALYTVLLRPYKHRWKNFYKGCAAVTKAYTMICTLLLAFDFIDTATATVLTFIGGMLASGMMLLAQVEGIAGAVSTVIGSLPCCNLDVLLQALGGVTAAVGNALADVAGASGQTMGQTITHAAAEGAANFETASAVDAVTQHVADDALMMAAGDRKQYDDEQQQHRQQSAEQRGLDELYRQQLAQRTGRRPSASHQPLLSPSGGANVSSSPTFGSPVASPQQSPPSARGFRFAEVPLVSPVSVAPPMLSQFTNLETSSRAPQTIAMSARSSSGQRRGSARNGSGPPALATMTRASTPVLLNMSPPRSSHALPPSGLDTAAWTSAGYTLDSPSRAPGESEFTRTPGAEGLPPWEQPKPRQLERVHSVASIHSSDLSSDIGFISEPVDQAERALHEIDLETVEFGRLIEQLSSVKNLR